MPFEIELRNILTLIEPKISGMICVIKITTCKRFMLFKQHLNNIKTFKHKKYANFKQDVKCVK